MKSLDIADKKILFFCPSFFHYENLIADKMRKLGAIVDMYDVRSVTNAFERALLKISPAIFNRRSQEYYEHILNENRNKNYDYIVVIKGDMTPENILKRFRTYFPNAKICLYLWDSVDNNPGIVSKFKYFDTLHSFDWNDCQKYTKLNFRPLFFADQYRQSLGQFNNKNKYDISFLGTIHSDRYAVIQQVQKIAKENSLNCYWFLYLQSNFIYWFYKIVKSEFRGAEKSEFSFNKKSVEEISRIEAESKIILDIQHPKQSGLTMRTIEMLGMNKKIITTNASIKEYDFYDSNNIAVIDRKNVVIDMDFLSTTYRPLESNVYEKYSLNTWLFDILS